MNAAAMEPAFPQDSRQAVENLAVELVPTYDQKSNTASARLRTYASISVG